MESGKWRVESGEWKVESGKFLLILLIFCFFLFFGLTASWVSAGAWIQEDLKVRSGVNKRGNLRRRRCLSKDTLRGKGLGC